VNGAHGGGEREKETETLEHRRLCTQRGEGRATERVHVCMCVCLHVCICLCRSAAVRVWGVGRGQARVLTVCEVACHDDVGRVDRRHRLCHEARQRGRAAWAKAADVQV
jgi:hypothetical protein